MATEQNLVTPPTDQGAPLEQPAPEPAANWSFRPETPASNPQPQPTPTAVPETTVSWEGEEFIAHEKSPLWFVKLAGAAAVAAAAVYGLTRDIISSFVIIVVAVVFGLSAARKPRHLTYAIDKNGLHIGAKTYPFATFKSFSVVDEQSGASAIWLMPLTRFMPILTVYYDQNKENEIVAALSSVLPMEERQPDAVDRLMQRIRF